MKSIKSVYKIGNGPSSSHTVGPYHAAQIFGERYPDADFYEVTLYGSLAFTGEGHGTGKAILEGLPGAKIIFDRETLDLPHPNTMRFTAFKDGQVIASVRMFSIGGGSIRIENEASEEDKEVYPQTNFSEIVALCNQEKISIIQLIYILEGYQLRDYLKTVWSAMRSAVERGLKAKGILPGGLKLTRKAKYLYEKRCYNESADVAMNRVIAAYAYAVSEENAAEIAMEHNLGLTCDPVNGLVQIPCIERNAVAAMRALSSVNLSRFLYATRKISFDDVVATMYRTGLDLNEKYRETAHGGLAQIYKEHLQ